MFAPVGHAPSVSHMAIITLIVFAMPLVEARHGTDKYGKIYGKNMEKY